jgi:hypothetical protein
MTSVDAYLREIEAAAAEAISDRSTPESDDADYRAALESMAAIGGEHAVEQLATELKRSIRTSETLPQNQSVRSLGRDICDREGFEIPSDSWFDRR